LHFRFNVPLAYSTAVPDNGGPPIANATQPVQFGRSNRMRAGLGIPSPDYFADDPYPQLESILPSPNLNQSISYSLQPRDQAISSSYSLSSNRLNLSIQSRSREANPEICTPARSKHRGCLPRCLVLANLADRVSPREHKRIASEKCGPSP